MGRSKKRFNEKGRKSPSVITDDSETKKIKLDLSVQEDKYDSTNAFVLPSSKRKSNQKLPEEPKRKPLSKKQKKKLQYILERKKKKLNRAQLLQQLSEVQASKEELKLMTSISSLQTKGLKRHFIETELQKKPQTNAGPINSIKGRKNSKDAERGTKTEDVIDLASNLSSSSSEDESESVVEDDVTDEKALESQTVESISQKNTLEDLKSPKEEVQSLHTETNTIPMPQIPECSKTLSIEQDCHIPIQFVPMHRTPEIQAARLALPILSEEQPVMEAIRENDVVILCGETGSGKTTQVPQFLYEAGYAKSGTICITEPRRVAAISMSKRVAYEMNLTSQIVSYQIRFEGNVTKDTKIKFVTDGVLMKEVQQDFLLSKYSVVIIDEAHERSVYSDILIGLLSRIVPLRKKKGKPLKMIIMSATLRIEDFTENKRLFKVSPPVVKVDSRQYPVTIHFNKRTPEDYLDEAFKKVCKIHNQLPEGGILVFLTGQQEVKTLCRKLKSKFPARLQPTGKARNEEQKPFEKEADQKKSVDNCDKDENQSDASNETPEIKKPRRKKKKKVDGNAQVVLPKIDLNNYSIQPTYDEEFQNSDGELSFDSESDDDVETMESSVPDSKLPLYVLPLYSLLPSDKQAKVFQNPPEGARLCVVSTNVAETSVTIPNVKYVVDSGKVKMRFYDKVTGVSAFLVTWTSKASANQRAGRAGRLGPGHCYRLYSSALFNDEFPLFSQPEIMRKPVDDLVLQMKAMNIDNVINFSFPSQPDTEALLAAEKRLILLGALEEKCLEITKTEKQKSSGISKITPMGIAMSCFPIGPRYSKMLVLSHQHDLLPYVIAVVSSMTVQEIFMDTHLESENKEVQSYNDRKRQWTAIRRRWAGEGHSLALGDVMVLLKAVGAAEYSGCTPQFCEKHGLRHKAMVEIRKLRMQLTNEVNTIIPDANVCIDPQMEPPSDIQSKLLRQIVLTGLTDHIARKMPQSDIKDDDKLKLKNAYECLDIEAPVFIHPSSILSKELPEFVVYQEIFETSRLYMKIVSAIEPEWLPIYAPSLCNFSKPLEDPPPYYHVKSDQIKCHVTATFGRCAWPLPSVEINFPPGLERYRWFGRFLLEGTIVPAFKSLANALLSPPPTMVKSWARLQPRTESLLKSLAANSVDSKSALISMWNKDNKYLLKEYQQWLPESLHQDVAKKWPPTALKSF